MVCVGSRSPLISGLQAHSSSPLQARSVHFASRWLWRHYLEPQWDPHARTREALVKEQEQTEKESTLGTGQTSRTMGGLRESSSTSSLPPAVSIPVTASSFNSSQHPLLEYYLIEEESSLSSPETAGGGSPKDVLRMMHRPTKSPGLPTSSSIKHLELHPTKAARVHFIRKFIRQSAAVFVMMLSSSQILYAYVCEPDTLARSYLSFLIVHGGVKQRCPENPLSFLNLMGDSIKAGASGFSSKFIAPPLDIFTPLPFHETVPNGLPADQMKDFAEWLCRKFMREIRPYTTTHLYFRFS